MIGLLSSMTLKTPVNGAGGYVDESDITKLCWPTYERNLGRVGGDLSARFSFGIRHHTDVENWLSRLMYHFEESRNGQRVFSGYVHSVRVKYAGVVLVATLDRLFNHVVVEYQANSFAAAAETAAGINDESVTRYGRRELRESAGAYMAAATADLYRDRLLAELGTPTARMAGIDAGSGPGSVTVEIRGYVHTLNWRHVSDASTATQNASVCIDEAVAGAEFVTAGYIETNTAQVTREHSNIGAWDRVVDVVAVGGSGGAQFAAMVRGQELEYSQIDVSTPAYYVDMNGGYGQTVFDMAGNLVDPALVRPGRLAYVRDVLTAWPTVDPLLDDPRVFIVENVTYNSAGARLAVPNRLVDTRDILREILAA